MVEEKDELPIIETKKVTKEVETKEEETKEDVFKKIAGALKEFKNEESNIPLTHDYWQWVNKYRGM